MESIISNIATSTSSVFRGPFLLKRLLSLTATAFLLILVLPLSDRSQANGIPEIVANQPVIIGDPGIDLSGIFGHPAGQIGANFEVGMAYYAAGQRIGAMCGMMAGEAITEAHNCVADALDLRNAALNEDCANRFSETSFVFRVAGPISRILLATFNIRVVGKPYEQCKSAALDAFESSRNFCADGGMAASRQIDAVGCSTGVGVRKAMNDLRGKSFK